MEQWSRQLNKNVNFIHFRVYIRISRSKRRCRKNEWKFVHILSYCCFSECKYWENNKRNEYILCVEESLKEIIEKKEGKKMKTLKKDILNLLGLTLYNFFIFFLPENFVYFYKCARHLWGVSDSPGIITYYVEHRSLTLSSPNPVTAADETRAF